MIGLGMRRFAFSTVLITLLLSLWGCGTYRKVTLPDSGVETDAGYQKFPISEGDSVRLKLRSGETYSGTVIWLTKKELGLDGLGNYGPSDLIIQLPNIEKLELRNQSDGQVETTSFLAVGIGLIAVFFWLLNSSQGN